MPRQRSSLPEQRPSHDIAATRRDEVFEKLIDNVYGDLQGEWSVTSGKIFDRFSERAIFTQSAGTAKLINKIIFKRAAGETYTSRVEDVNYSAGWTNGEFDGTTQIPFELAPERKLNLKIGMPILLTEHSFMKGGLVRGTRLVITGIYDVLVKNRPALENSKFFCISLSDSFSLSSQVSQTQIQLQAPLQLRFSSHKQAPQIQ
ncbi:hypothetical protein PSTG_05615 [Puccinia striiformis f. sp. tritici PST-78]|uniref:DNA helicase Pif1-like 2B domain-containing protein n=1 Tax=Puccinia striiformis f. sp. tritici PST-78 TaxID=1165861 RepID=A0A0L0VPP2_9BASI|nr:hypothetical protein PSTG_05615 [Puccinia striiformis f. sp. tritici PST-78]